MPTCSFVCNLQMLWKNHVCLCVWWHAIIKAKETNYFTRRIDQNCQVFLLSQPPKCDGFHSCSNSTWNFLVVAWSSAVNDEMSNQKSIHQKGSSRIPTQINKQLKIRFYIYFQRKLIDHVINHFKDWRIHIGILITLQGE